MRNDFCNLSRILHELEYELEYGLLCGLIPYFNEYSERCISEIFNSPPLESEAARCRTILDEYETTEMCGKLRPFISISKCYMLNLPGRSDRYRNEFLEYCTIIVQLESFCKVARGIFIDDSTLTHIPCDSQLEESTLEKVLSYFAEASMLVDALTFKVNELIVEANSLLISTLPTLEEALEEELEQASGAADIVEQARCEASAEAATSAAKTAALAAAAANAANNAGIFACSEGKNRKSPVSVDAQISVGELQPVLCSR